MNWLCVPKHRLLGQNGEQIADLIAMIKIQKTTYER